MWMSIDPDAEALLMTYPWPGNLRQMRHVLRTAAVLAEDGRLSLAALPPSLCSGLRERIETTAASAVAGIAAAADDVEGMMLNPVQASERAVLLGLLEEHRWNVSNVAKALDISRNTLYRRLHRLRILLSHGDAVGE